MLNALSCASPSIQIYFYGRKLFLEFSRNHQDVSKRLDQELQPEYQSPQSLSLFVGDFLPMMLMLTSTEGLLSIIYRDMQKRLNVGSFDFPVYYEVVRGNHLSSCSLQKRYKEAIASCCSLN